MTEILKLTYGTYPKTEKLRIRIGRWERGVLGAEELETLMSEETETFQGMARDSRIDGFSDPLFNWYDIFRPLSVISGGIELGPLTRYGETNTFYRLPEIRGKLVTEANPADFAKIEDNPPLPLYHVDQGGDQLAFLPGPETFFHFCGNVNKMSFGEFSTVLGGYYSSILSKFRFRRTLIFESVPLEHDDLSGFYSHIRPSSTVLFTVGTLKESSLASTGGKFHSVIVTPSQDNISSAEAHSDVPGVSLVDAHNTKLENPAELKISLDKLGEEHGLQRMYVTHNDYLDFLPRKIADKKLQLLGRVGE